MVTQVYEIMWLGNDGKTRYTNVQASDAQRATTMFKEHWAGTGCLRQIKEVKLL